MSNRRTSWLLPALSIIVTMLVTGGVLLYLNPDRASALDDAIPTGGSLVVAAAESERDCAFECSSGSGVCGSSLQCTGGSCTVEDCLKACDEAGVECSAERVAACIANRDCSGGGCAVDGKGGCTPGVASPRSGGCCSK